MGAALTNNFNSEEGISTESRTPEQVQLRTLFDHFIESRVVGLRKPDPAMYKHALQVIGCQAEEAIFLDDIGKNLKSANQLGIHTIHVGNETPSSHLKALEDMQRVTGLQLLDDGAAAQHS